MADPDCIFCKILAGELPATVVDEDEATIAFMLLVCSGLWRYFKRAGWL